MDSPMSTCDWNFEHPLLYVKQPFILKIGACLYIDDYKSLLLKNNLNIYFNLVIHYSPFRMSKCAFDN